MIADEKCIDNSLFIDDDGHRLYLFFTGFNDGRQHLGGRIGRKTHDYQEGDHAPLHPRLSGMGGGMAPCE